MTNCGNHLNNFRNILPYDIFYFSCYGIRYSDFCSAGCLNNNINIVKICIGKHVNLYGAVQYGKTAMPTGGGTVRSKENFRDAELYEAGAKSSFFEDRLFASAAVYYWDQGTYNDRAGYAEIFRSKGLELELAWEVNDNLSLFLLFQKHMLSTGSDKGNAGSNLIPCFCFFNGDIAIFIHAIC